MRTMRIHHLSCGSMCPYGGYLWDGVTPGLGPATIVCHCLLIEAGSSLVLCSVLREARQQWVGLIDGRAQLLVGQATAVIATWVLAIAATFVILKVLDATMGLRVRREEEIQGLDLSQHGEEGYIFI